MSTEDNATTAAEPELGPSNTARSVTTDRGALDRGSSFGRYLILHPVGVGGMGVVYAAYDPALDRRIALKILRPETAKSAAEQRLLREAAAMARLQHPNVVTVHDVGSHQGRTYVAMEFVEGCDLRRWLRTKERSWRDILDVFAAAGEGLAAAHSAGLVHRDLKPANIMVGNDGRVRVSDFGLARAVEPPPPNPPGTPTSGEHAAEVDSAGSPLDASLTATGTLVGTPAFMAPEQILEGRVDYASDQFSFCVSLYLSLYGEHPFGSANSFAEHAALVIQGQVVQPHSSSGVPRAVNRAILRGLSARPEDRFASIGELVAALRHDPLRRRRRWAVAGAGLLAGAVVATGVSVYLIERGRLCSGGDSLVSEVWNADRRAQIEASFINASSTIGASSAAAVAELLDGYRQRWLDVYGAACEATRVRWDQSESLLDLEVTCLKRRLREADALLDLLTNADLELVADAADAMLGLRSPESCGDTESLLAREPLPEDPQVQARIEAVSTALSESHAQQLAGDYDGALARTRELVTEARSISYAPLLAEALCQQGQIESALFEGEAAESTLRECLVVAERGGDEVVALDAMAELVLVTGTLLRRDDMLEFWSQLGLAKLDHTGAGDEARGHLLLSMGSALVGAGRFDQAIDLLEQTLPIIVTAHGEQSGQAASCLNALANAMTSAGRFDGAIDRHRETLAMRLRLFGPLHPTVAVAYNNLSYGYNMLGRSDEALESARHAIDITERVFGPDHVLMADPLTNLGYALQAKGDHRAALDAFRRAERLYRAHYGDAHPQVGTVLLNIATVYHAMGDLDAAIDATREAEEITRAALGEDNPTYAYAANNLGVLLYYAGRASEAVPHLEQALRARSDTTSDEVLLAVTRFNLGRALWESGRRDHGKRLVEQARDALANAGERAANDLAAVQAWLAEH